MESAFRSKIASHIKGLPSATSQFAKFYTNPFVLMFYSKQRSYSHVKQIEKDLVPAKVFSSMETSAGNMVQNVVLPIYGWEVVHSTMHSHESLLDGRKIGGASTTFVGATLKSGPRTLNDDMARNIGNELVHRASSWAVGHGATEIDFTYGGVVWDKKTIEQEGLAHSAQHRRISLTPIPALHFAQGFMVDWLLRWPSQRHCLGAHWY